MPEVRSVDAGTLRGWPLPGPGDDKEMRGRVLVVGGSRETPGAVLLAVESALRVGAGKLRVATVDSCAPSLGVAIPEARVAGLAEDATGNVSADHVERILELADGCTAVLLGPGSTDARRAAALVAALAPRLGSTLVLDALATAYVSADPDRLSRLTAGVVVTVNPGELAHCLDTDPDAVAGDPEGHSIALARRTGAVVLCGGTRKVVAHGDRVWRIDAGNPGLGVSGSGDAQAGMVAGLLGRGAEPDQAAVWGAFLHATAGDRLAGRIGPLGYLARELPAELPGLLTELDGPDAR